MTMRKLSDEQIACRAAIRATLETLLDLEISDSVIIEALANATVDLAMARATRSAKKRISNDDLVSPVRDNGQHDDSAANPTELPD